MKEKVKEKKKVESPVADESMENGNELGLIRIHENVIASVVRKVTCSVEGVARLAGSTLVDNIAEIVGSRKIHDRSIAIDISGDTVKIEVKVNIAFGVHVPTVAMNIQQAVMEQVEKLTGMKVTQVNVVVQELDDLEKEEKEDSDEEEDAEEETKK